MGWGDGCELIEQRSVGRALLPLDRLLVRLDLGLHPLRAETFAVRFADLELVCNF